MRRFIMCFCCTIFMHYVWAHDGENSAFFRDWYQYGDLVHYLDNLNDHITYQAETTGEFNKPDILLFSIDGNSFRWNKYYLDGFRVDSRFFAGSSFYRPDLQDHSLHVDYMRGALRFYVDDSIPNHVKLTGNAGGLGGISWGTKQLINLFHETASERLYKPIDYRAHIVGAGSLKTAYGISCNGQRYLQQLSFNYGQRSLVGFDEMGINEAYPENYYSIQLMGQLPFRSNVVFDKTNYLFHASAREHLFSELYYGKDETAKHQAYSFSMYGQKMQGNTAYTAGLTWAVNQLDKQEIEFSRNVVDQDGEAFEPWYTDGATHELTYAMTLAHALPYNLTIDYDGYNSLLVFRPDNLAWQNTVYYQMPKEDYTSLYLYNWTARPFEGGLLENEVGLSWEHDFASWLSFNAGVDFTFDALLLKSNSMVSPNWQAEFSFSLHPVEYIEIGLNVAKKRISYTIDDMRFLSEDYLNADIYYWRDENADQIFQENERSDFFTTTGGASHVKADNLRQAGYLVFDIPVVFRYGAHSLSLLNTYRKYFDTWFVEYDKPFEEYGYYVSGANGEEIFMRNNQPANYVVWNGIPEELMQSSSFLTNTPYYMSSTIKYEYIGRKFRCSVSWQSYMMAGISSLGNGPLHNNVDLLSESTANPNIAYKALGRLDQDRAYVGRLFAAYNINDNWGLSMTFKFKDGQPFTSFSTLLEQDEYGNTQIAVWNERTKGINPVNGDFGSRKDAFFNLDLRLRYRCLIKDMPFEIQASCYNLYDFGTELTEYTFVPIDGGGRDAMSLNIPRGILLSAQLEIP